MKNINTYLFRILFPFVYIIIVASSLIFMFSTCHDNALCGVYAIVLTIPWSMIFIFTVSLISPDIFNSMIPGTIIILISAFINIILLLLIGYKLDKKKMRKSDKLINHKLT